MVKACKIVLPFLLLLMFCTSVFAYTATQVIYQQPNTGNFSQLTFYTGSYAQIGADDISVTDNGELANANITIPTSIYVSGLNNYQGYLNGVYHFSYSITVTGSESTNFRNFNVTFNKAENDGLFMATYQQSRQTATNAVTLRYTIWFVFKNFAWNSNAGQDLFTATVTYSNLATNAGSFQCNIVPEISLGTGNLSHTSNGVVDDVISQSVADAINSSTDIDTVLQLLTAVSSDTALMSSILRKVSDLDTKLALVLTRLQKIENYNNQQISLLQALLFCLSGTNTIDSSLSVQTINRWVSIIKKALQEFKPTQVPVDDKLSNDLHVAQQNNDAIESTLYQDYDTALQDVNFSPVTPGNIVHAISTVTGWLELIYSKLGVLQWVIILTCTVGIVLIVLGRFRLK